jgi:hypothetical protein
MNVGSESPTILLVDKNRDVRVLVKAFFENAGYRITRRFSRTRATFRRIFE